MRIFKTAMKVLGVLLFAVLLNSAVTFAFVPYASKCDLTWRDYRQQDNLDLVFVGNSRTAHAFNPQQIGDELGVDAFNTCTQGQLIEESYLAVKKVVDEHHPETIVFGFDFCDVQGSEFPNPGRAFVNAKDKGDLGAYLSDCAYYFGDDRFYTKKESINWLFPWVDNHVKPTPGTIAQNVKMKIEQPSLKEAVEASSPGWTYFGKGYSNLDRTLDYNQGDTKVYTDVYKWKTLDDRKLQTLADMADYCKQNDVEFVVAVAPLPVYNVLCYGNRYFDYGMQVRNLVSQHGGQYYDFNLAKPGLYDTTDVANYADFQHLNTRGAAAASEALVNLFKACESGEDVRGMFYSQDQYEQAHQYVDLVQLDATCEDGSVNLAAMAYAGKGTPVEYQFCAKDAAGTWQIVRDWSGDSSFEMPVEGHGMCEVRVNARKVGSTAEFDRYRVRAVTY